MLASCTLRRACVPPLHRVTEIVLTYKFSSQSDDSENTGNNRNGFYNFCLSCGCACGNKPVVCYDVRKYGHCLPQSTVCPDFDTLPNIPTGIFRCTAGEHLGPRGHASKRCLYLNPEFFAYHHMSYYDLHYVMRQFRLPSPQFDRKPP